MEKLKIGLYVILQIGIAFLVCLFFLHLYEFQNLDTSVKSKYTFVDLCLNYLYFDLTFLFLFLLFLSLISCLLANSKFTSIFLISLSVLTLTINFLLSSYFNISSIPLDEIIYQFNFEELKIIAGSNSRFSLDFFLWYFSTILVFFLILFFLIKNHRITYIFSYFFFLLFISIWVYRLYSTSDEYKDQLSQNKTNYFLGRSLSYCFRGEEGTKKFTVQQFKGLNENFVASKKLEANFPLNHLFKEKSEFLNFLKVTKTPPSIVFIIVESLSSDLVGKRAKKTGNLMPFLDSLATESLYFPNFLSTAERTHNVLPASLSSVPNAPENNMLLKMNKPEHNSLVSLLKSHYFSRFYCGVKLNYSNMNSYMNFIETDYLVNHWDKKFTNDPFFKSNAWGHPDGTIFEQSNLDLQKYKQKKPRLDIFLTISSHDPFNYPNKEQYTKRVLRSIKNKKLTLYYKEKIPKNPEKYGSFVYVDDQIKNYFNELKKDSKTFENTVFFIFGDHGSELCYEDAFSKFRIPLLIYSPLLKVKKQINAINSHLNLAPTIVNYLQSQKHIPKAKYSSFIGTELEFSDEVKRNIFMPFNAYNLNNEFLLFGKYYLDRNELFVLTKELKLQKIKNDKKVKELKKQLKLYNYLSSYLYFENKIKVPEIKANKKNEMPFYSNKIKAFEEKSLNGEFIEIGKDKFKIPENVKKIRINLTLKVFLNSYQKLENLPLLVVAIDHMAQGQIKNCFWSGEKIKFINKLQKNNWNQASFDFYLNLKDLEKLNKSNLLHYYLYNHKKINWNAKDLETKVYYEQ